MPVDIRLTYYDFCQLPDDGKRYEIIDGELFVTPSPRITHQKIVTRLSHYLLEFVENNRLGQVFVAPLDVVFSDYDVVEPDVFYVSNERAPALAEGKNVQGSPDLVVEVLSETTENRDRTIKLKLFARFDVREYWMIEPNGPSAEIYRRTPQGLEFCARLSSADLLTSPLLPGFSVPLTKLLA
jgi:Uma2 family endonuclease